jgi:hypothetical protein
MLPIQFAIELETALSNQLTKLSATDDMVPLLTPIRQCQGEFLELLSVAKTVDIDIAVYPQVKESQLLGPDTVWQQFTVQKDVTNTGVQVLITLWQISSLIDKTVQFYQQAATNSAHPHTRLFFNSLCHVKRILHRRFNGIIQIYCNHYWGELGFAPFMLGKD